MFRTKHAVIVVIAVIVFLLVVLFGVLVERAGGSKFSVEHSILHVATVDAEYGVTALGSDQEANLAKAREALIAKLGTLPPPEQTASETETSSLQPAPQKEITTTPVTAATGTVIQNALMATTSQPMTESGTGSMSETSPESAASSTGTSTNSHTMNEGS